MTIDPTTAEPQFGTIQPIGQQPLDAVARGAHEDTLLGKAQGVQPRPPAMMSHDTVAVERDLCARGGKVLHHFGDGPYVKEAHLPAGTSLGKHVHPFDHASAVVRGRVRVHVEGEGWREFSAGTGLTIRAGKSHTVEAVTDAIWLCIHDAEGLDGDVDAALIAKGN